MCLRRRSKGKQEVVSGGKMLRQRRSALRYRRARRVFLLELLERRDLLTQISFTDAAERFSNHDVTGVTIVTHGYQPPDALIDAAKLVCLSVGDGDSLMPLAQAIRNRADAVNGDGYAWLLDYDVVQGGNGNFDSDDSQLPPAVEGGTDALSGEVVLLFDWAAESNELSAGWG
ncbi:MAG: hypothetical protein KDB03_27170, partial [Planctomycetales bacterium]|nr:hypothetical protein [Planctomycetales bacterium]